MKKQILERLHALASDMEDVGLAKYADKVNDVFEIVAAAQEEQAHAEDETQPPKIIS